MHDTVPFVVCRASESQLVNYVANCTIFVFINELSPFHRILWCFSLGNCELLLPTAFHDQRKRLVDTINLSR